MKKISFILCSVLTLFVLTGCGKKADVVAPVVDMIADGDTVGVNYTLTLADGTVKDTSFQEVATKNNIVTTGRVYEPLTFTVGKKQMIPGFENGVRGMKAGENKKIPVSAVDGYGERNEKYIQVVSGSIFTEAKITPKVGDSFNFSFGPGKIIAINGDALTVDFNHPLAGQALTFDVTVVTITKAAIASGAVVQ